MFVSVMSGRKVVRHKEGKYAHIMLLHALKNCM